MKIEKNIPIPRKYNHGIWTKLAEQMDVGDSILVDNTSQRAALSNALKGRGCKLTTRSENGKFRVWRLT